MRLGSISVAGIVMALLLGCAATGGREDDDKYARAEKSPSGIPVQFPLYDRQPVLLVRVIATDAGYEVKVRKDLGVPSQAIDKDRDVLVAARYADGTVAETSVFNPREVHTTGARNPASAVRAKGSFAVSFTAPDSIRTIEITTRRGPNQGLKTQIDVARALAGGR